MNVVAGSVRGFRLITPSGSNTRPTSNRIKETLFNILQWEIPDSRFLDLFSGSGGIAIEALSRGAAEAVLVESDREALRCIRENVRHTKMEECASVMAMDAMQALRRLDQIGNPFDIIFMDPPYQKGWEEKLLPFILQSSLVQENTWIIMETPIRTDITWLQECPCRIERIKEYKTNQHIFLQMDG